ncbi:MAG TPA: hypothetical protein VEB42_08125, partial [Chitinophagaceae bacterium]|nr:hypothetical protein [Chitinophagaceae bacterium]
VLKYYLANRTPALPYNSTCNGYLITAPQPYDQQPVYVVKPLYSKPDSCECTLVNSYYLQYQTYGQSDADFSAFLLRTTGVQVSNGTLDSLRMACNNQINCNYLEHPLLLPSIMQCGVKDVCVNCGTADSLYRKFAAEFPGQTPQYDNTDSAQRSVNKLFENFMNTNLGFAKSHVEYLRFLDSCHSANTTFRCDTLNKILNDFALIKAGFFDTVRLDGGGCDTAHWKLNHGGAYYTVPYPLNQIFVGGVAKLPAGYTPAFQGIDFDYYSPLCIGGGGFTFEVRMKIPDSTVRDNYFDSKQRIDVYSYDEAPGISVGFGRFDANVKTMLHPSNTVTFTPFPVSSFDTFRVVKIQYVGDSVSVYLDTALAVKLKVNKKFNRFRGWSIGGFSFSTELDYIKLYDSVGDLRYFEDFQGCSTLANPDFPHYVADGYCNDRFVLYFNQKFGTSYTISQIDSIYWQHCGIRVNVCAADCGLQCDSLRNYYQEFQSNYDSLVTVPCIATNNPYTTSGGETLSCCQNTFKTFINAKMGTSYTYQQLLALYSRCGMQIDPCPRPVTGPMLCGKTKPVFVPAVLDSVDNCSDSTFYIISKATELYKTYTDSLTGNFDSAYRAKCLEAYKYESFTVTHAVSEYHYTLYYYDQAGNLVKTVPPQGVQANYDSLWLDSVKLARSLGNEKVPGHTLVTQYRYNTLNQVVAQLSPDGGATDFWYDRLGRLVISSNAKQKANGSGEDNRLYSYTKYDVLGRITEVGQVKNTTANGAMTDLIARDPASLESWNLTLANRRGQITSTSYDVAFTGFGSSAPIIQRNLRNRVSFTTYTDTATLMSFNNGTFFTYDIHGNVDTLLQHYGNGSIGGLANVMNKNNNGYKKIVYQYDLISGKVNMVAYNPRNIDEFYHC